jgi:protein-tyrosine kinase
MNETTDASAIFAPIWRRKWLILIVGLLVAVLAYVYYKRQASVYSVTTQVYLANGTEEQSLLSSEQGKKAPNERAITDQATIVNSNLIGEAVRGQLRKEDARAALKGKAKAKAAAGSDFITITAEAGNAKAAAKLANTYAQTYITRQRKTYQKEVRAAIVATRKERERVEAQANAPKIRTGGKGSTSSSVSSGAAALQVATLVSREGQFLSDLSVSTVSQVSPATAKKAELLSPMPKKNAIFGFVLGILLASIAAYALGRFDRRLRSLAAVEDMFHAPILAAIPHVNRPLVHRDGRPALATPLLEPLRRAHTALQLGNMVERTQDAPPRLLLALSADGGDGRSTLVAGLALVQRDAGERVAVVESDFRRPVLAKLLDVSDTHGLAQVLAGRSTIEDAAQRVGYAPAQARADSASSTGGGVSTAVETISETGSASVFVSGGPAANPPALLAGRSTVEFLHSLSEDFDSVLIDAPSPVEFSDVLPLLHLVDGIVILARLGHTREASAQRLVEILQRSPSAPILGVVANDVKPRELARLGFSPLGGERGRIGSLLRR